MARSNLIKAKREQLGLTQYSLAMLSGLHPSTIAKMERGEMVPTIDVAEKVADALHSTVALVWPKEES